MIRALRALCLAFTLPASVAAANDAVLAGTSWTLVEIRSIDDTAAIPEDPSRYTLSFLHDGSVAIGADCNRGKGSWASEGSGQVTFGPIASTFALCPPESISEEFLAQFSWIRSYMIEDGHLFLATMADGSILEFERGEPLVPTATVLGENVTATDADALRDIVLARLFERYAEQRRLEAEQSEIDALLADLRTGRQETDLSTEDTARINSLEKAMVSGLIRNWKVNRALHEQFGGRIIYQQLGPEPLDAIRQLAEVKQSEGELKFHDEALSEAFWAFFTDDARHDFMPEGSDDAKNAFASPPWE